jgi:hypothetical protein
MYSKMVSPTAQFRDLSSVVRTVKELTSYGQSKDADLLMAPFPELKRGPMGSVRRQNLFCTLLNIARKMSDQGWYADSSELLAKLNVAAINKRDWSTASNFISIELAINAVRANKPSDSLWAQVDKQMIFFENGTGKADPSDYSVSEKLRRLAIAFFTAGETDRSDVLISRAVVISDDSSANSADRHVVPNAHEAGPAGDQVLLMLSAASIKAAKHVLPLSFRPWRKYHLNLGCKLQKIFTTPSVV